MRVLSSLHATAVTLETAPSILCVQLIAYLEKEDIVRALVKYVVEQPQKDAENASSSGALTSAAHVVCHP